MVVLQLYLIRNGTMSPKDWLYLQLGGSLTSSGYHELLEVVRKYLQLSYPTKKALFDFTELITTFYWQKEHKRVVVAIDEANILIEKYPSTFSRPFETPKTATSPLWYLFGGTLTGLFGVALVVAGTRIRLQDTSAIYPTVKRRTAAGQSLQVHINFR